MSKKHQYKISNKKTRAKAERGWRRKERQRLHDLRWNLMVTQRKKRRDPLASAIAAYTKRR